MALVVAPFSERLRFVEPSLARGSSAAGLRWKRVGSCPEAEALLGSERFAACLFDLALGEAPALRLLRTLQARGDRWQCPMVVLGTPQDEDLIVRVLAEGAADYLLKETLDEAAVLRAVRYAIELGRGRAAAHAAEARAERLFADDLAGMFRLGLDGRLQACNRAFLKIFGFDSTEAALAEETSRLRPERSLDGEDGDWILDLVGPLARVLELRRVNGSAVTVKLRAALLTDASRTPYAVEGSVLDINWLEGSLNPTSAAALERNPVWEIVGNGLLILDRAGRIEHTNRAARALLGWSRRRIVGRTLLADPINCRRSDGSAWRPAEFPIQLALTLEHAVADTPILVRQPGGGTFSLYMTATPVESFGGSMSRRVLVSLSRLPTPVGRRT